MKRVDVSEQKALGDVSENEKGLPVLNKKKRCMLGVSADVLVSVRRVCSVFVLYLPPGHKGS